MLRDRRLWPKVLLCAALLALSGCIFDHRTTPFGIEPIVDGPLISDCNSLAKWSVSGDGLATTGTNFLVPGFDGNAVELVYTLDAAGGNCFYKSGTGENYFLWGPNDLRLDATGYDGISFFIKGTGKKVDFQVCTIGNFSGTSNDVGTASFYDWDFYYLALNTTYPIWTRYDIKFSDLARGGFTTNHWVTFRKDHITRIDFEASSRVAGENGKIVIDDVRLFKLAP
jgi:hypothetical protein